MGNTRSALSLIIAELSDIEQAVEFCKEHDDAELWSVLIDYSLDKPIFINFLLNNIGTHVDPRILVEKIKEDMNIPGLRDSLIQIMRDYNLQVSFCTTVFTKSVLTQPQTLAIKTNLEG